MGVGSLAVRAEDEDFYDFIVSARNLDFFLHRVELLFAFLTFHKLRKLLHVGMVIDGFLAVGLGRTTSSRVVDNPIALAELEKDMGGLAHFIQLGDERSFDMCLIN